MEERLKILKTLRDKRVTVMNKNLEIQGAFRNKKNSRQFCLSTDDPVLTGERVRPYNGFLIFIFELVDGHFSAESFLKN